MRKWILAAIAGGVIASVGAVPAFAGEVKGPPYQQNNTNDTAAPSHANSACAYSGLNDFNQGQTDSIVQTAADAFKYYGYAPGVQGTQGFCQGGTN